MTGRSLAIAGASASFLVGGWWAAGRLTGDSASAADRPLAVAASLTPTMTQASLTGEEIAVYQARVQRDPQGAADRANLAGLYLQRSRETGDFADYRRAEEMARQSIAIRVHRNPKAYRTLAASLLAQHRFVEARVAAEELVAMWPDEASHRALLGEIQLELGDYEHARRTFRWLSRHRENLAVAPRLARWAEISGQVEEEGRILREAARHAYYRTDLPREQVAWFFLRLGEHELRYGRVEDAEKAFRDGLADEPNDFRLVGGLVRLEAQRQQWERAIAYGERLGDGADLRTLGVLGDAHAALGNSEAAERFYAALERRAAENPEPFNRQWTQFRLDHGRHLPEALALLEDEIRTRPDVLGYDMLAWALYGAGRYADARAAMARALRMGTQDPTLLFHAGMIEQALGANTRAREYLERALALNPIFHHTYAAQARAALRALRAR